MAQRGFTSDQVVTKGNALMQAEVQRAAKDSQQVSTYEKISEYMFWGATSLLAVLAAGTLGLGVTIPATVLGMHVLGGAVGVGVIGALVSGAAFLGSMHYSGKAANLETHNRVLHSDIDSQNQAHRMVQAFAKAQSQGQEVGEGATIASAGSSWTDRVGGAQRSGGSWMSKVDAERQSQDAAALQTLSR